MKDTCKQTSQHRRAPRVELICTGGDQPKSRIQIFQHGRLTSEYDLTDGKDKITLLSMFQQNQLEDVRTNITVWLTSLAIHVNKLKKLNHVLDEEYQIPHILASLPREYSCVVEQVKIDRRTDSALITMDEIMKRLKECYLGNMVGLKMKWP